MSFKSDIEIAQETTMQPITEVAKTAGIDEKYLEQYGKYKAKVDYSILKEETHTPDGKLVLVTAINPTPAGEGKTTTTVGLADGLRQARQERPSSPCASRPSGRSSASRAARPAAAMRRSSRWRTSTSTSPATSTPSARPTTCWRPCWITTFIRAIALEHRPAPHHLAPLRRYERPSAPLRRRRPRRPRQRHARVRTATTSPSPPRSWRCCAWPPTSRT